MTVDESLPRGAPLVGRRRFPRSVREPRLPADGRHALSPEVRLRAMLPPGPMDWEGPATVAEVFGSWFGSAADFELIDAAVGEVGGRLHLSWRVRVRPAPFGIGDGWHVIEQQAYADAGEAITSLDLLCSGFRAEPAHA